MTTYYLVDMHVPDASLEAASRIVDVVSTARPTDEIRVDGLVPIKIPDGVQVDAPTSLADLLDQKYRGLHAQYPGFGYIAYDALLDSSGIAAGSSTNLLAKIGARASVGGRFTTNAVDVSANVAALSQCIVVYEHYTWKYVDRRDGRVERYFIEQPESGYTVNVTVKVGGVHPATTTSGALVSFSPAEQGSSIQLQFLSNPTLVADHRLVHTGSWAVIY